MLQSILWKVEGPLAGHGLQVVVFNMQRWRVVLRSKYMGRKNGILCGSAGEFASHWLPTLGHAR